MALSSSTKVKNWRISCKQHMVAAMGHHCQICRYSDCMEALEFHHLDPTQKDFGFASIRANPSSWDVIVAELRKCILLCCRCHREVHSGLTEIPAKFSRFNEEYARYTQRSRKTTRTNWDGIRVIELLETHKSVAAVARYLSVSETATWRRLHKEKRTLLSTQDSNLEQTD